jgi:hypothetical protein
MMPDTDNDEADEIVARIEELELLQEALRQARETLELFLKPAQPIKRKAMQ